MLFVLLVFTRYLWAHFTVRLKANSKKGTIVKMILLL